MHLFEIFSLFYVLCNNWDLNLAFSVSAFELRMQTYLRVTTFLSLLYQLQIYLVCQKRQKISF